MGALLSRFALAGVRFELADDDGLDAIGPLTDELRAEVRTHRTAILCELQAANDPAIAARPDDRRRCDQCRRLNDEGLCLAAFRGESLGFVVPRVYHPVATLPQHCAGYSPFLNDPDQRPARDRWPSLTQGRHDGRENRKPDPINPTTAK
jgi:hypothetical protein